LLQGWQASLEKVHKLSSAPWWKSGCGHFAAALQQEFTMSREYQSLLEAGVSPVLRLLAGQDKSSKETAILAAVCAGNQRAAEKLAEGIDFESLEQLAIMSARLGLSEFVSSLLGTLKKEKATEKEYEKAFNTVMQSAADYGHSKVITKFDGKLTPNRRSALLAKAEKHG